MNDKDKVKARGINNLNADALIDLRCQDFNAAKLFVNRLTGNSRLPAYVGLAALLCVHGSCRLHEFDELAMRWNFSANKHNFKLLDTTNDNILRSMYALFDVCYYDEQRQLLVKNLDVTSDIAFWHEWLKQFVTESPIELFSVAKLVKHSNIV